MKHPVEITLEINELHKTFFIYPNWKPKYNEIKMNTTLNDFRAVAISRKGKKFERRFHVLLIWCLVLMYLQYEYILLIRTYARIMQNVWCKMILFIRQIDNIQVN